MASSQVTTEFRAIEAKYGWDPAIVDWLLADLGLGAKSVNDFVYALSTEDDAKSLIDSVSALDSSKKMLMMSRVKQAWTKLRQQIKDEETLRVKGYDETEMDTLLPQPALDSLQDVFYRRYRVSWPAHMMPSDQVLSRLSKELDKRALTVRDIWKVRSQAQQMKAQRKKQSLGAGIDILHAVAEDDKSGPQTLREYLDKLFTLMLAYAMVGAKGLKNAPDTEPRGSDTLKYVEVPLDMCLKHHARVCKFAYAVPYSVSLEMVVKREFGDREQWVDYFRTGDLTLGAVIQKVYEVRDATWQVPEEFKRQPNTREKPLTKGRDTERKRQRSRERTPPRKPEKRDEDRTPVKLSANDIADKMRNGDRLCREYQFGRCNAKNCPKGKHVCARKQGKDRVCGGPHPACKCTLAKR